jgi:hypothetical protein
MWCALWITQASQSESENLVNPPVKVWLLNFLFKVCEDKNCKQIYYKECLPKFYKCLLLQTLTPEEQIHLTEKSKYMNWIDSMVLSNLAQWYILFRR